MDDLLSEQHPASRRWAMFEDDGTSGWLYLTEPGKRKPIADCWIYNRIPAPAPDDISSYRDRGGPPPAPEGYAGPDALVNALPDKRSVRFVWSLDGESVALHINQELMGFIAQGVQRGFSKNLVEAGPWGRPLDSTLYAELFSNT
jgi:hypothetical protein